MDSYKEFLQWAVQMGVGGALAAFIFLVYNRTTAKHEADSKGREELLMAIVTNNTAAITKHTSMIEANIAVTNELRRDLAAGQQQRDRR